ncbi:transcriptional regulator [Candidatus Micrarchaeota archaeon]|nr:transcriptional regulator [Candidatus Micrarchaeota archaeon]
MEETGEKHEDLVCQSCGMPMEQEGDFGTNADGSPNKEFCIHCYQNGVFTEPDISMREMIEKVMGFMVNEGMPREEAEKEARETIPHLNRWRKFGTEYL